jgi:histidine ammonia-lyase
MDNTHYIVQQYLETVNEIISQQMSVELSDEAKINIQKCRDFGKMATHSEPIYGINTGFGSLCNVKISNENLLNRKPKSHACGTGRSAKGNRQTDALA